MNDISLSLSEHTKEEVGEGAHEAHGSSPGTSVAGVTHQMLVTLLNVLNELC